MTSPSPHEMTPARRVTTAPLNPEPDVPAGRASAIDQAGSLRRRGVKIGGPVRILDDHQLVADTLAKTLRAAAFDARTLPHTPGPELLAVLAGATRTGLVLLDLELGRDTSGQRVDTAALVGLIRRSNWRVLALADDTTPERIGATLAAGASGVIQKAASLSSLLDAIGAVIAGRPVNPADTRHHLLEAYRRHKHEHDRLLAGFAALTPREREVLHLLAAGRRAQAIAAHHLVSLGTVRAHIRSVLTKLGVRSQIEAVALYARYLED